MSGLSGKAAELVGAWRKSTLANIGHIGPNGSGLLSREDSSTAGIYPGHNFLLTGLFEKGPGYNTINTANQRL